MTSYFMPFWPSVKSSFLSRKCHGKEGFTLSDVDQCTSSRLSNNASYVPVLTWKSDKWNGWTGLANGASRVILC